MWHIFLKQKNGRYSEFVWLASSNYSLTEASELAACQEQLLRFSNEHERHRTGQRGINQDICQFPTPFTN